MMTSTKMISEIPKSRVELHVHLDGSLRPETIWELSKQKNLALPGDGSFRDLRDNLVCSTPKDLHHFLKGFAYIIPAVVGDFPSIERISYEFCQDKAAQGVAYVEARYNPHIMLSAEDARGRLDDLSEVIRAVNRGFARGEKDFGLKVRTILCSLNGTDTIGDVLKLCERFRGEGVVALDVAALCSSGEAGSYVEVPLNGREQLVYDEARKLGIHRTVHAGESGDAEMVRRAVEVYHSERIGHGYNVVKDRKVYGDCMDKNIHFEACPWSSFLTGSVPLNTAKHPIIQFAEDGANFSLNSDDTTVTGLDLGDDYSLASKWGLSEAHLVRANMNAARSCFLPDDEKTQLLKDLKKIYGFDD